MTKLFSTIRPLLHALPPEVAHDVALRALRCGLLPPAKTSSNPMLEQTMFGLRFKNPVGLAAGFDKNAFAINALFKQGFGFVEAGTVTPLPQSGNPKPRVFRLTEDKAVINRLGFNNHGLEVFVKNFRERDKTLGIAGANIGKNKDTEHAASDYVTCLNAVYAYADYITINISSPNTKGLRDLQQREALSSLLGEIANARKIAAEKHSRTVPILLKIAPDITQAEREDIATAVTEHGIDGIIISNTTISRPDSLINQNKVETGGLSGAPLFALSTQSLAEMYKLVGKKIPLIGVGGIASPEDAYAKIRAGASLVQLYSALVYQGFGLVSRINSELPKLLARDGFKHIGEATGSSH
jgi:dihydroorotate dehydrogenase